MATGLIPYAGGRARPRAGVPGEMGGGRPGGLLPSAPGINPDQSASPYAAKWLELLQSMPAGMANSLTPEGLAKFSQRGIKEFEGGLTGDGPGGKPLSNIERLLALFPMALEGAPLLAKVPAGAFGTFAGRQAKTANLPELAKAEKLEKARVSRDDIWRETGWGRGADNQWRFEIDDSKAVINTRQPVSGLLTEASLIEQIEKAAAHGLHDRADGLGQVLSRLKEGVFRADEVINHPELLAAYPNMADMTIRRKPMGRTGGSYHKDRDEIHLNENLPQSTWGYPRSETSVGAHEFQHAIQGRENFARGGNQSSWMDVASAAEDEKKGLELARTFARSTREQAKALSDAEQVQRLNRLSNADRITPSQVTGLGTWYQYSHKVWGVLGPMPKRSGDAQKAWLRSAAAELREHVKAEIPSALKVTTTWPAKELKAERKRISAKLAEAGETERKYNKADELLNRANDQHPYKTYRELAGESEASNAQTRLKYSKEKRREIPPWKTEEVPRNQQIVMGRKGLLNF